jgi:uncharacterized protein YigE (DUF2233 family)
MVASTSYTWSLTRGGADMRVKQIASYAGTTFRRVDSLKSSLGLLAKELSMAIFGWTQAAGIYKDNMYNPISLHLEQVERWVHSSFRN